MIVTSGFQLSIRDGLATSAEISVGILHRDARRSLIAISDFLSTTTAVVVARRLCRRFGLGVVVALLILGRCRSGRRFGGSRSGLVTTAGIIRTTAALFGALFSDIAVIASSVSFVLLANFVHT